MPTGAKTFRSEPPQSGQSVSGSSVNFWKASNSLVQAWQRTDTWASLCFLQTARPRLALGALDCQA